MHNCSIKNPNGNMLDELACNEMKKLSEEPSEFIKELQDCQRILARLKRLYSETKNQIKSLVATLSKAGGTASEEYIIKRIDELDGTSK